MLYGTLPLYTFIYLRLFYFYNTSETGVIDPVSQTFATRGTCPGAQQQTGWCQGTTVFPNF